MHGLTTKYFVHSFTFPGFSVVSFPPPSCIYSSRSDLRTELARCSAFPTVRPSNLLGSLFLAARFYCRVTSSLFYFCERLAGIVNLILGRRRPHVPRIWRGLIVGSSRCVAAGMPISTPLSSFPSQSHIFILFHLSSFGSTATAPRIIVCNILGADGFYSMLDPFRQTCQAFAYR